MSKVKVKITYTECVLYIDIAIKTPSGQEFIKLSKKESSYFVNNFWIWDISGSTNGEYEIIVRGFYRQDSQEPIVSVSTKIELEWVEPTDLISVAEIYDGDGYLWGGDRCPGHPYQIFRDKDCNGTPDKQYNGVVDCSHYVYQCLMRLGRGASGYNLVYKVAFDWQDWNRVERIGWMDSISTDLVNAGDIILWHEDRTAGGDCTHIAIFSRWVVVGKSFYVMDSDGTNGCGLTLYDEVKDTYEVFTWEYDVPENTLPIFHEQ